MLDKEEDAMFLWNSADVEVEADVEGDHHELEDDQDVSSPPLRFKVMMLGMLSKTMCIQTESLMSRVMMK